jgi:nucleoside-diphosphate-sugar epimerase
VEWRAADVFAPDTWRDLLEGADAVVHSIATIQEDPAQGVTFDRVNAESALILAEEAVEAGVEGFVYLSVRDKPPFVSRDFLAAKRRAEREVPDQYPDLRTVSLRPNLVYGPGRRGSATIAAVLNHLPGGVAGGYAADEGRPLPVELVAATAVQAATTPTLKGTLTVPEIADVGRTSGLVDLEALSEPTLTPLLAGLGGAALGTWLLRRWWTS